MSAVDAGDVSQDRFAEFGPLVLRLALGATLLAHGVSKLANFTGAQEFFSSLGLYPALVVPVVVIEVVAGLLLLAGFRSRWAALASLPVLLGATWVHAGNGWLFSNAGGGWEFPLFLVLSAVSVALAGSGAYSIEQLRGIPWRRRSLAA